MVMETKNEALTEEELKELRRRKKAQKKKLLEKKKAMDEEKLRALLEDEEAAAVVETPEERRIRLYAKAQKKMSFAPHMYRREDQADMYRQAAELFAKTEGYEQAEQLCTECRKEAQRYRALYVEETYELVQEQLTQAKTDRDCFKIREKLASIADFKDVSALSEACAQIEHKLEKKQRNGKIVKICVVGVVILALLFVVYYIQDRGAFFGWNIL